MIRSKTDFHSFLHNVTKAPCSLKGITAQALRMISCVMRSFPNNAMMAEEKETPLHVQAKYLASKFVLKSLVKETCFVNESLQFLVKYRLSTEELAQMCTGLSHCVSTTLCTTSHSMIC